MTRLRALCLGIFIALAGRCFAADFTHDTVSGFGGVPLAVVEAGRKGAPAILFIHGTAQAAQVWQRQLTDPGLARDFHLIAFDLRGHGASGKPWKEADYDEAALAGDVKAVIEATAAGDVVLVPWSYGGLSALAYVRRFGLERVAGINITASRSAFGPSQARASMTDVELAALRQRSAGLRSREVRVRSSATREFIRSLSASALDDATMAEFYAFNMMTPAYVLKAKRAYRPDNSDLAPRLSIPVLISNGDRDSIVAVEDAKRTQRMIAGSRLSIYEGAGHMPFFEQPVRFNRELAAFVREVAGSR